MYFCICCYGSFTNAHIWQICFSSSYEVLLIVIIHSIWTYQFIASLIFHYHILHFIAYFLICNLDFYKMLMVLLTYIIANRYYTKYNCQSMLLAHSLCYTVCQYLTEVDSFKVTVTLILLEMIIIPNTILDGL